MKPNLSLLAGQLPDIAKEAGRIIMVVRNSGDLGVVEKMTYGKPSPFTRADTASHTYLMSALQRISPDIPIVSEENDLELSRSIVEQNDTFWLMDPLDGTKSFIKGQDDFAVNIALIDHGKPVLGAVYFPSQQLLYYTGSNGKAYRQRGEETAVIIDASPAITKEQLRVAVGHKDTAADFERMGLSELLQGKDLERRTNARRICLIAEGGSDLAVGTKLSSTWDTAGPDAVLRAAGGVLLNHTTKQPMTYGKEAVIEQNGTIYPMANPSFMAGHRNTLIKLCGLPGPVAGKV